MPDATLSAVHDAQGLHPRATAAARGRPLVRAPFIVSVAVALVLNGVLIAGLAMAVKTLRSAAPPDRQVTWVTAVSGEAVRGATTHPAATPPQASRLTTPLHEARSDSPRTTEESQPAWPPARPAQDEDGNEVRFYRYREVDLPAEPDSDWNLNAALLDGAGIQLLAFEVFISATGEIVGCTILQPTDLPADMRDQLEHRLRHTGLKPAIREGVFVPSVRRIELSVH